MLKGCAPPEREGAAAAETTCIKVLVRVRPTLPGLGAEEEEVPRAGAGVGTPARGGGGGGSGGIAARPGPDASCVSVGAEGEVIVTLPRTLRRGDDAHSFRFGHVAAADASQAAVFGHVGRDAVHAFLDGFNAAIFAYGQTGRSGVCACVRVCVCVCVHMYLCAHCRRDCT